MAIYFLDGALEDHLNKTTVILPVGPAGPYLINALSKFPYTCLVRVVLGGSVGIAFSIR